MTSPAGDALYAAMLECVHTEDWLAITWWSRVGLRCGTDIFL